MSILKIHTDGGCANNQKSENIGGWGAILEYGENVKELCGGELNTTNNRMEMTALIEALSALKRSNLNIEVFSDSSYLMNCFREKWYEGWQKNGWLNAAKKPVENRDLWERLLTLTAEHNIKFNRIKGHVAIDNPSTKTYELYKKFVAWNGNHFTYEDFVHATRMNIRADELVHMGMQKIFE